MRPYAINDAPSEPRKIHSIDLRIERGIDDFYCYYSAFCEELSAGEQIPYDHYKIVRNCDCRFETNLAIRCAPKQIAIVFYRHNLPIRLLVGNQATDLPKMLKMVFETKLRERTVQEYLKEDLHIHPEEIALPKSKSSTETSAKKPKKLDFDLDQETQIYSCHTWTQFRETLSRRAEQPRAKLCAETGFLTCKLTTDTENFKIWHEQAFFIETKSRDQSQFVILAQKNSPLTSS